MKLFFFISDLNHRKLVNNHLNHPDWGGFAERVMEWGPHPRNGKKSDQAHPPIHPLKLATSAYTSILYIFVVSSNLERFPFCIQWHTKKNSSSRSNNDSQSIVRLARR